MRIMQVTLSIGMLFTTFKATAEWIPLSNPDGSYIASFGKLPNKTKPKWKMFAYKSNDTAKLMKDTVNNGVVLRLDNEAKLPPAKFANYSIMLKKGTKDLKERFVADFRIRLLNKDSDKLQFCIAFVMKRKDGRPMNWSFAFGGNSVYCHMRKTVEAEIGNDWHDYRVVIDIPGAVAKLYMDGSNTPLLAYNGYHYKNQKNESLLRFGDSSTNVVGKAALASLIWKNIDSNAKLFSYDPSKSVPSPGVLLTFDDDSVSDWVKAMPIFAKYNAKVTFFVDRWDLLTHSQIEELRSFVSAGHAVCCHSMRHYGAVTFTRKNSLEGYLNAEVRPAVKLMKKDGFNPTAFAYPMSQHNKKIDKAMLKIFRHLRGGCSNKGGKLASLSRIFTPINSVGYNGFLCGTCVQPHSANDPLVSSAAKAFERAAKQKEIVIFYAHDIRENGTKGPKNYITPDALDALLKKATDAGLKFYTFKDLP